MSGLLNAYSSNSPISSLTATCSPPKALGGTGYCGPPYCANLVNTKPYCVFTSQAKNYASIISTLSCATCTQSTDARCSTGALKSLMFGTGIKAAYCNDQFLVIHTDMTSGFNNYLSQIPTPPGSIDSSGTACVTGATNPSYALYKIPLFPTALSTATNMNNIPGGFLAAGDVDGGYLTDSGNIYGMPTRGAMGVSIGGQDIYPVWNNRATATPQWCEVDTCNEHVGGGGGQPHLHGDPFGSWCLYSEKNYSSPTVHPPQIGWSFDGGSIYGRHVNTQNLGYNVALDACGGHVHDGLAYHYHAQIFTATTKGNRNAPADGTMLYATTTGPYQCWKNDISKITNFWKSYGGGGPLNQADSTVQPCCQATNYYTLPGITIQGAGTQANSPVAAPTYVYGPTPSGPTPSGPTPVASPTTATPPVNTPTTTTVSSTGVTAALSTSGASLTTALATAYPGIQVSNPTVTAQGGGTSVSVTQNIPSGVTLAQASSQSFLNAYAQAVATTAGIPTSSVTGLTASAGRRLLAGVNMAYTIINLSAPAPLGGGGGSTGSGSSSSANGCFMGSEMVHLSSGEHKSLAEVQIGDYILTINAQGEPVFSPVVYKPYGHNEQRTVFTTIITQSGYDLTMTSNHMLPAGACDKTLPFVAAADVMVGDCVQTISGKEQVVSVGKIEGKGIYTVIAMEELIVVNGIVATPFGGVNPTLANIYYNLHRVLYSVIPAWIKNGRWVQGVTEGLWRILSVTK